MTFDNQSNARQTSVEHASNRSRISNRSCKYASHYPLFTFADKCRWHQKNIGNICWWDKNIADKMSLIQKVDDRPTFRRTVWWSINHNKHCRGQPRLSATSTRPFGVLRLTVGRQKNLSPTNFADKYRRQMSAIVNSKLDGYDNHNYKNNL